MFDPTRIKRRLIEKENTDLSRFIYEVWFPSCIDNGEHKPKTISFYNDTSKNIVSYFHCSSLQKISPIDIQAFLANLRTAHHLAPQTIRHHYRTLNMIFSYAHKLELILTNPMDKVPAPKLNRKPIDAFTKEQAKAFLHAVDHSPLDFRCMLYLLLTTGIRRAELLGFKWCNLNETAGVIHIAQNVTYTAQSGTVIGTPKTQRSIRTIPVLCFTKWFTTTAISIRSRTPAETAPTTTSDLRRLQNTVDFSLTTTPNVAGRLPIPEMIFWILFWKTALQIF